MALLALCVAASASITTFGPMMPMPMPNRQHHRQKPSLSPGCRVSVSAQGRGVPPPPPDPFWTVSVVDELGELNRTAYVDAPAWRKAATPRPLLLGFHKRKITPPIPT